MKAGQHYEFHAATLGRTYGRTETFITIRPPISVEAFGHFEGAV